jgi:serine/threonine-protein kinase HipA
MNTSIRYLRLYLHCPAQGKRAIGYLSQYGDILRVSFDPTPISRTGHCAIRIASNPNWRRSTTRSA